jgi:hypothetical protein
MISPEQFEELEKHHDVFDLAIIHNYIPSGQNGKVMAIEGVHKAYFKVPTDMSCGSCVFDMIRRMNIERIHFKEHYKPLKETNVPIVKANENKRNNTTRNKRGK